MVKTINAMCIFIKKLVKNQHQVPWNQTPRSQTGLNDARQYLEPGMSNSDIFISGPDISNFDVYIYALKNEIKSI